MPVTAVPVFLRRLFRHGRLLVTRASGMEQPRDLIDRRVGIHSF